MNWRKALKYIYGAFFVVAGVNHFVDPSFYLKMMPPYLPAHEALNYISGAAEIVLGIALMVPKTQRMAAWGLIALLIAVFPANLYMAQNPELFGISADALYVRLPMQLVLIYFAWRFTRKPA